MLVWVSHSQVYILLFFLILIYVYATCSNIAPQINSSVLVRVNNRQQENSFVLVCVSHSQVYILFFFLILIYVYATCSKCKLVPYYVKSIDEILTFQLEGVSDTNRKRTEQRAKDISYHRN